MKTADMLADLGPGQFMKTTGHEEGMVLTKTMAYVLPNYSLGEFATEKKKGTPVMVFEDFSSLRITGRNVLALMRKCEDTDELVGKEITLKLEKWHNHEAGTSGLRWQIQ